VNLGTDKRHGEPQAVRIPTGRAKTSGSIVDEAIQKLI
jgi:hypothetical protein